MLPEQHGGVWLVVGPESSPVSAVPVPRQACLGLARAVLAGEQDPARWRVLAGDDPSVSRWIVRAESLLAAAEGVRDGRPSMVAMLSADLVCRMPGGVRPPSIAAEAAPADSVEAAVLREAVARMLAHAKLAERFDAEVADARLEAMKELAYGAGHEINNPLANIATRAQALLLEERDAERRRRLATIADQAFRARDMIGGLMLFARPPKPQPGPTDLNRLLESVTESVQSTAAARGARIERACVGPDVSAWIDESQIAEAVRAVVLNAVEAVGDGGRVVVSGRVVAGCRPSRCEIVVVDDGRGMDAATLRRACDPFFSGREAGRGAGLGLSKASRFVQAASGGMKIESRPGHGTTVTIMLPAVAPAR